MSESAAERAARMKALAEKAAYLHYGVKGRIEASKFMDNVKKDSEVASQNVMQSEFNQILREKGL